MISLPFLGISRLTAWTKRVHCLFLPSSPNGDKAPMLRSALGILSVKNVWAISNSAKFVCSAAVLAKCRGEPTNRSVKTTIMSDGVPPLAHPCRGICMNVSPAAVDNDGSFLFLARRLANAERVLLSNYLILRTIKQPYRGACGILRVQASGKWLHRERGKLAPCDQKELRVARIEE